MKDVVKGVAVKVISIVVIASLVIGGGYLVVNHFLEKYKNMVSDDKKMGVVDILEEKLEATAELNTADYLCTYVEEFTDAKKFNGWKIPLTTKSFTMSYEGVVKAGIKDLTKAQLIEGNDGTVVVKLPAIEITSHEINKDTLKVYDESHNIFNPTSIEDFNEAQKNLEKEMVKRAEDYGLLDNAKSNAEKVIKSMLQSANNEYSIVLDWQ